MYFKYQVALDYKRFAELKDQGLCHNPLARTSRLYNGLSLSKIWNWHRQADDFRSALTHEKTGGVVQSNRVGKLVPFKSKAARKMCLRQSRGGKYEAAEAELISKVRRERTLHCTTMR